MTAMVLRVFIPRETSMRIVIATLAILIAGSAADGLRADPYRWCAEYSAKGGTNCYFMTLGQCRAAISGIGGFCRPNTFYTGGGSRRRSHDYR
jgi:hypothetical protein